MAGRSHEDMRPAAEYEISPPSVLDIDCLAGVVRNGGRLYRPTDATADRPQCLKCATPPYIHGVSIGGPIQNAQDGFARASMAGRPCRNVFRSFLDRT